MATHEQGDNIGTISLGLTLILGAIITFDTLGDLDDGRLNDGILAEILGTSR